MSTLSANAIKRHENVGDGIPALGSDFGNDVAASSTASSPPPSSRRMSVSSASSNKTKVAIMKYQFGNYDYMGVDEKWRLPEFTHYEVQGFFFASAGLLSYQDKVAMESYGWNVIDVDLELGTPYVTGERVTTKKFKFCVPQELRVFDFVITHDCDVFANYELAIPHMLGKMEESGNAAVFQLHERQLSTLEEIDLFLNEKPHRILTSREKVKEWRAAVMELVRSQKYDLSGSSYIKANCFAFRPNDPAFQKAGQRIFEKCLYIQRDQFIVPWAIQEEHVNYSLVSTVELESNGFVFPVMLRDARTGVFN